MRGMSSYLTMHVLQSGRFTARKPRSIYSIPERQDNLGMILAKAVRQNYHLTLYKDSILKDVEDSTDRLKKSV